MILLTVSLFGAGVTHKSGRTSCGIDSVRVAQVQDKVTTNRCLSTDVRAGHGSTAWVIPAGIVEEVPISAVLA